MHLATLSKSFDLGNGIVLEPDAYLVTDVNAAQMLLRQPDSVQLSSYQLAVFGGATGPIPVWAPRDILIASAGAIGDSLLLTPAIYALNQAGYSVTIACHGNIAPLFDGLCKTLAYPARSEILINYLHVFSFEYAHEDKELHMTDSFAKLAGVELTDKKPIYHLTNEDTLFANSKYPKTSKKRIGMQIHATAMNRTYPHSRQMAGLLVQKGYEVMLLGAPGEITTGGEATGLINCTADRLTIRQSAAALSTCDGFIGPDSSMLHFAGTLGLPAIGLFGAFSWQTRTKYYPTVFSLQGSDCSVAPCHFHGGVNGQFPKGQPCGQLGYCTALASITPERAVAKLEQLICP